MARAYERRALRQVVTLYGAGAATGLSDAQLLERFLHGPREAAESAFETLVHRHGPMVWGVCRSVLRHPCDTEDAFQVTFLVLARKAASVRARDALGHWLYGVARRVAVRAKTTAIRRQGIERQAVGAEATGEPPEEGRLDAFAALHEEIDRLPDAYRRPVVLCYLNGMTYEEAAHSLRLPESTLRGRLARARERLRQRLSSRCLSVPAGLAMVPPGAAPPALTHLTVCGACQFATGKALSTGVVSSSAQVLMKGVIATMFLSRLRVIGFALALAAVSGIAVGASVWAQEGARRNNPPEGTVPAKRTVDPGVGADAATTVLDDALAERFPGRVVGRVDIVKDCMVLAYLPEWSHGQVDNLGVANNDGGVRTLLAWAELDPRAVSPDARFVVALYARGTTANGPAGPLHAFALRGDWPERTSWNSLPDYDPEPAATYKFAPGEGWKLFDVTDLVRADAKAGRKASGVMLRFLSEDRSTQGKKNWSGYQLVSREGTGEWAKRRPVLLVVEPSPR